MKKTFFSHQVKFESNVFISFNFRFKIQFNDAYRFSHNIKKAISPKSRRLFIFKRELD
jgi:hypothetical protein